MNRTVQPRRQQGVSLVELMISMLLGLIMIAVVFQVYLSSRQTQQLQSAVSARQETLRFATLQMKQEINQAGYRGCNSKNSGYYDTLQPNTDYLYQFQNAVQGAEAVGGAWLPVLDPGLGAVLPGTDVLTVRYARDSNIYVRESMPTTSSVIKINLDADLTKISNGEGEVAIMTNCRASSIFQMTGYEDSSGTLGHNTGFDPPVGNRTKDLGEAYTVGAQIMVIMTVSYFLRDSPDGTGPSLFRKVNGEAAVELVKGVENMQVLYGLDPDGDGDVDSFVKASAVLDWSQVAAVRVGLLAASIEGRVGEADPRTFTVLDTIVGPFSDRRLRRVQTLTMSVRNALP